MKTLIQVPVKPQSKPQSKSLLGTTWAHKDIKAAGPAVGAQLPNQFIIKFESSQTIAAWQVGGLSPEPSFWNREEFLANFTQLNLE